jgi:DNA gyrase subunit A
MRLARLTGLEREKLAAEYGELLKEIERLRAILADAVRAHERHRDGARGHQGSKFADKRRTEIVPTEAEIDVEDLIQEEDMVVTISHAGTSSARARQRPTAPRSAAARARSGWRPATRTG